MCYCLLLCFRIQKSHALWIVCHYSKILTEFCLCSSLWYIFMTPCVYPQGMLYLHTSDLISHGNLRSSNCVVTSRWTLKGICLIHTLRLCSQFSFLTSNQYEARQEKPRSSKVLVSIPASSNDFHFISLCCNTNNCYH